MSNLYMALVHHPVRDRTGETVTTSITNVDVHDLSRSARTFGLAGFFVVTPIEAQRRIVDAILSHWDTGAGRRRVPERREALALCQPAASIADAVAAIGAREGAKPRLVATAAASPAGREPLAFADAARRRAQDDRSWLLLFGTGHGLSSELLRDSEVLLPPIRGGHYNHLSVRAAAAITLDRLVGEAGPGSPG